LKNLILVVMMIACTLLGIFGALIHFLTIFITYRIDGIFCAFLAFCFPFIAEFYCWIRLWQIYQTPFNLLFVAGGTWLLLAGICFLTALYFGKLEASEQ